VTAETERTPADSPVSRIPPEVLTAFALLAVDALLVAWQRKRVALAARVYRARREFLVALDTEGGVKTMVRQSLPRRFTAPGAAARRRS
jgi:hypothetical protein